MGWPNFEPEEADAGYRRFPALNLTAMFLSRLPVKFLFLFYSIQTILHAKLFATA